MMHATKGAGVQVLHILFFHKKIVCWVCPSLRAFFFASSSPVSFGRMEAFGHALKEAFEFFMNARQTKPAELVAKWMDARLRAGGAKGLADDELEARLDAALGLFRCAERACVPGVYVRIRIFAHLRVHVHRYK